MTRDSPVVARSRSSQAMYKVWKTQVHRLHLWLEVLIELGLLGVVVHELMTSVFGLEYIEHS